MVCVILCLFCKDPAKTTTHSKSKNEIETQQQKELNTASKVDKKSSSSSGIQQQQQVTAKSVPTTTAASTSGTVKKSLDSVIAKLYHQTSSGSGSTASGSEKSEEKPKPAVTRHFTPTTTSQKLDEMAPVDYSKKGNRDSEATIEEEGAITKLIKGQKRREEELSNKESAEKISKEFVQKLFTESAVITTSKKVTSSAGSTGDEKPISIVKPVMDVSSQPPVKRQRTQSPKYAEFRESLKPSGKDNSSTKESPSQQDKNKKEESIAVTEGKKETGSKSTRNIPARESPRIQQKKETPKQVELRNTFLT